MMAVLGGAAVSYERGTPVAAGVVHGVHPADPNTTNRDCVCVSDTRVGVANTRMDVSNARAGVSNHDVCVSNTSAGVSNTCIAAGVVRGVRPADPRGFLLDHYYTPRDLECV